MKNLTRRFVFLLTAVFCGNVAFGRLGETPAQVEAVYGKPSGIFSAGSDERRVYQHDDLEVEVLFVGGKSLRETYHHPGKDKMLANDECLVLAREASGSTNWSSVLTGAGAAQWRSGALLATKVRRPDDGSDYFNIYGQGFFAHFQSVQTNQWAEALKQEKQNSQATNSAGPNARNSPNPGQSR